VRVALEYRTQRLGVIAVAVSERDPAQVAPTLDLLVYGGDVAGQRGAGVHEPGRVAADEPRVGPLQREGPRIVGTDPDDVMAGNFDAASSTG
jgi:hypothetical protein